MTKDDSFLKARRRLFVSGAVLIVLALALLLVLFVNKRAYIAKEVGERAAEEKTGPEVRVVTAQRSPESLTVTLTGEARPYATVTLYAKVSGYLKDIPVDKGDRVSAGQVLAVIESPELDRQYEAAVVDAQDKKRDAERAKELVGKKYISQQDADHAEAAAREAEANAEALRIQKGYEILRAPFHGTVTARFADPGALVQSATTSETTALPLVTLSQTDRLRVYVYLDQRYAALVRIGDRAEISDASRPEIRLPASVSRISGELDSRTRTLLTELDVQNRRGLVLAGSFVQVSLKLRTAPAVEIPAEALLMKGEQAFVAVIASRNTVSFRPVTIGDSDGKTVRLSSGLDDGEQVVLNPGFGIEDGEQVQPVPADSK